MRAIHLANYFVAGCIASSFLGMDSEFASHGSKGDRLFSSSSLRYLGLVLAFRLLSE
jgi:hypothetical protein